MRLSTKIILFFLLFFLLAPSAQASITFQDSFTALDETHLTNYNPKYIPVQTDNAKIQNNKLIGHSSPYYYNDFDSSKDQSLSFDILTNLAAPIAYEQWVRHSNSSFVETKLIINTDGSGQLDYWDSIAWSTLTTFLPGQFHNSTVYNLKTAVLGNSLTYYIDNFSTSTGNVPVSVTNGNFGFSLYNNDNYFDESVDIQIDNLVFQTFAQNILAVPLLKQTSDPWQSQTYDTANIWSPSAKTIKIWGCALTSAAMVFQYYGYNKLPKGINLDPGTLNIWLKSEPDGYIGEGIVNWLALSRLSRLSKNINNLSFDALEYSRTNGNTTQLNNDINSGVPDILKEPGHFVVAKGVDGSTFDIKDPYYNRDTLDNGYGNSFLGLGSFRKSNTDLSYIMLTAAPNFNISVTDTDNNHVGQSFIEDSISNPENPSQTNKQIKIFYFAKPNNGNYRITLSSLSSSSYNLNAYLYDMNGNVKIVKLKGYLDAQNENYIVSFNKLKVDQSIVKRQLRNGRLSIVALLEHLFRDKHIDSKIECDNLISKLENDKNINSFISELNKQKGKHLDQEAYDAIQTDLEDL